MGGKKKRIVATKLPKLQGREFNSNFGNEVAVNEGKKNCGNQVAEIGEKKKIWAEYWREKKKNCGSS